MSLARVPLRHPLGPTTGRRRPRAGPPGPDRGRSHSCGDRRRDWSAIVGRVVVAAFGNELRGDDGFGIAVLRRLEASPPTRHHVTLLEVGTAGLRLAQELLTPCDRLIVIDAMTRGGRPGTVYVLRV